MGSSSTEGGLLRPSQPSAVVDLPPVSMYEKNDTNCQHVYQCIGYLFDMWALVQTEGGLLRPYYSHSAVADLPPHSTCIMKGTKVLTLGAGR